MNLVKKRFRFVQRKLILQAIRRPERGKFSNLKKLYKEPAVERLNAS
jgi:hypothetical protein